MNLGTHKLLTVVFVVLLAATPGCALFGGGNGTPPDSGETEMQMCLMACSIQATPCFIVCGAQAEAAGAADSIAAQSVLGGCIIECTAKHMPCVQRCLDRTIEE